MKEACGVFAVHAPGRAVAQMTFDGLFALQHRGQESAGMAVSDGESVTVVKDMGLVMTVFDERTVSALPGDLAIGHTRYSTTGRSEWRNAQPVFRSAGHSGFALGHNGNLTNTAELAARSGMLPGVVASDSDLIAEVVAAAWGRAPRAAGEDGEGDGEGDGSVDGSDAVLLEEALKSVLPSVEGAYSIVAITDTAVMGARDPHGFRPLCLGRLRSLGPNGSPDGWVLASETPALDVVGATFEREVQPGELVVIDGRGVRSVQFVPADEVDPHLCIFEFVYFARPDSRLYGREVHGARRRMGELLAGQRPVEADLVMGVPESGVPAAEGYARASGIPHGQGLVKNRYIGRTFITPGAAERAAGVRRKLNPLKENVEGKRLVVVDDSIVRGTTQRAVVGMLREAGAAEVHLRISSPPLVWPCFYGIDIPDRDELVASDSSIAELERFLGVDSLEYLTLDNLIEAIDAPGAGFCSACLTGDYPVPVPVQLAGEARASLSARP
ncbi:MAG: amidophosphoribosyltransferase [Acidimicrobiales bacterium]